MAQSVQLGRVLERELLVLGGVLREQQQVHLHVLLPLLRGTVGALRLHHAGETVWNRRNVGVKLGYGYQLPLHGYVINVDNRYFIAIRKKYGAMIDGTHIKRR